MPRIINLKLKNFRGFENSEFKFKNNNLICLIGRGDSGKSTILDSINFVFSPNWKLNFFDHDFHNGNISIPIEIEATIINPPERLISENKYGLYIRGWNPTSFLIEDELKNGLVEALTIKLIIENDLEPKWYVTNERIQDDLEIGKNDRAKINSFLISDDIDNHFKWNEGNPLLKILKSKKGTIDEEKIIIREAIREAREKIDKEPFSNLDEVIKEFKTKAKELGAEIATPNITVDFKDLIFDGRKTSLHDKNVPFRLKGKGSKRILSISLQYLLAEQGGIIQVDEIEQGLEPDRVQHLVTQLKKSIDGQIFITTHSQNVIVELDHDNLYLVKEQCKDLIEFTHDLQGCLRAHPHAFFAKKIIVCEGATEVGICRSLNEFRIKNGKLNAATKGVCFIDGVGNNQISYSKSFRNSKFSCALFCDSDDETTNEAKQSLTSVGVNIFDWEGQNSTEQQIFKDLPWGAILKLIDLAKSIKSDESVKDSVEQKHQTLYSSSADITQDNEQIRNVLGIVAASKSQQWFKKLTYGVLVGEIIFNAWDQITETNLYSNLEAISNWIDND